MVDRVRDWIALIDERYPERNAEDWDATGLQVGDPGDEVGAVLVCLDVTTATLDEAQRLGADLVLAHHPLLFRPLRRLTPETAAGRLALRAARAGLAVLAAHTNVDSAAWGTTEPIVELLDLREVRPLAARSPTRSPAVKLVTFVPREATAAVLEAMSEAGGGVIGEYDQCSFQVSGTGTFRPSQDANPAAGDKGVLNHEAEERLEMLVPGDRLSAVVEALWAAHPYEEVAYDVLPLLAAPEPGTGLGRVGQLAEPTALADLAARLAEGLPAPFLRFAGEGDRIVRRVAACGGAGDSLIGAAVAANADVYVTGDLRHHPTLDALESGLAVIDAGHYATEAPAMNRLADALEQQAAARGLTARLLRSSVRTEPWTRWVPPVAAQGRATGTVPAGGKGAT